MIEFRFSLLLQDGESSTGAEFGDMEIIGNAGRAASQEPAPGRPMLIQLSVATLLDELASVLRSGRGSYKFQGVASTFSLQFKLKKNSPMVITADKTVIHESDPLEVATAFWSAANGFADRWLQYVPREEPLYAFFAASLTKFSEALDTLRQKSAG